MLKRESRRLSEEKKEKLKNPFKEIKKLNASDLTNREYVSEKLKIRRDIENYYEQKRIGNEKRACEMKRKFANSSRIDRFYVKKGIHVQFVYSGNESYCMSDHRIIYAEFFIKRANVKIKNLTIIMNGN